MYVYFSTDGLIKRAELPSLREDLLRLAVCRQWAETAEHAVHTAVSGMFEKVQLYIFS